MKKNALLVVAILILSAPLFASSLSGTDFRSFAAAVAAAFGFTQNGVGMSAAALSANGLSEVSVGDFAVITQSAGKATGAKKHVLVTLPDGSRYEDDINQTAVVGIVSPIAGGHLYVPANNSQIEIKSGSVSAGYDKYGIAAAVNDKVKKGGGADVIITMKSAASAAGIYSANTPAGSRASAQSQFQSAAASVQSAVGGKVKHRLPLINAVAAHVDAAGLKNLSSNPNVERVDPDLQVHTFLDTSTNAIHAPYAWGIPDASGHMTTGEGVRIAVIDTGVDYTLSDLGGCFGPSCKVEGGWDFVNDDADPMDDQGHGTHVAATAAGVGSVDATRLYGVAPGAHILAYKVLNSGGSGSFSDVIAGINRAVDPNNDGNASDHVDVISMSLGATCWDGYTSSCGPTDPVALAIDAAASAGVVSAIAAGNSSFAGGIGTPGTALTAITVAAACAPHGSLAPSFCTSSPIAAFSSRGPVIYNGIDYKKPDITAPGVMICAAHWADSFSSDGAPTCFDSAHVRISGTSMATPHVAGVLALLKQQNPTANPTTLKNMIKAKATNLGSGATYNDQGAGQVSVQKLFVSTLPVRATPATWSLSTSPTSKYSSHVKGFALSTTDASIGTLTIAFVSPKAGVTFTPSSPSINLTSTTTFSGTIQVDNDIVKAGSYTASITLKDSAGVVKGAIPVFIVVKPTFSVSPATTLDYGLDDPSKAAWSSRHIGVTVRNLRTDVGQTITMSSGPWPAGATFHATALPPLPPSGSTTVDTYITATNSTLPNATYTGSISFTNSANTTQISRSTTFKKFYVVNITTGSPAFGMFGNSTQSIFFTSNGTDPKTLYLDTPGTYSLLAEYWMPPQANHVVKEGISVSTGVTNVSVNPQMAVYTIAAVVPPTPIVEGNAVTIMFRGPTFGSYWFLDRPGSEYSKISPISSAYQFAITNSSVRPVNGSKKEIYFVSNELMNGVSADNIANPAATQYRTLTHKIATDVPSGTTLRSNLLNGHHMITASGAFRGGGGVIYAFPLSTPIEWLTHSFAAGTGENTIQVSTAESCSILSSCNSSFFGPVWFTTSKGLSRSLDEHANLSGFETPPMPLLPAAATSTVSIGLGPVVWNGKFANTGSLVSLKTQWGYGAFLRQDYALMPYDSIPFKLINIGYGYRLTNGTIPAFGSSLIHPENYFWHLWNWENPNPEFIETKVWGTGAYQFTLDFPYTDNSVAMKANVDVSFNTSRGDPNPPFISQLMYSTNGIFTDQYYAKAANNRVLVRLDPNGGAMKSVAMSYSLDGTVFKNLAVTVNATSSAYVALIPKFSTTTAPVISVRFVATDKSDNSLQYIFQLPVSMQTPPGHVVSAPTASFTANGSHDTTVSVGDTINYVWSSTNGVSASSTYTVSPLDACGSVAGPNSWSGGQTLSGSNPTYGPILACQAGRTYTITYEVTGTNAQKAVDTVVLRVRSATTSLPTASLTASPTSITVGQSSNLSWTSTNATGCTGGGFRAATTSGSKVVLPATTTTYVIRCFNNIGTSTPARATVTVSSTPPPPTATLSASPNPCVVSVGSTTCSTTLSWNTGTISKAQIWMTINGSTTRKILCGGATGSATRTGIHPRNSYVFNLYVTPLCTTAITGMSPNASVTVTANPATSASNLGGSQVASVLNGVAQTFLQLFEATFGGGSR